MRIIMNKDKQRLATMLEEKKISKEDHDMLQTALKRKSFFAKMQSSIWLNPFQKIAGFKALILGMLVLISPASSMNLVGIPYCLAFHVR